MSLTKVTYSMIAGESANILDFGADTANSAAQNTLCVQAALDSGKAVFVPKGVFLCGTLNIPSNTRIYGDGYSSELKFSATIVDHFLKVIDKQNVTIENLRINVNKVGTGFTSGSGIEITNTSFTFEPLINNVIVRGCWIDDPGFAGIGSINSQNVIVDGNYITGSTDSGIAAVVGSNKWVIVNNHIDGFLFGISLSTNGAGTAGIPTVAQVGFVRDCIVSNNVCNATKTSSYGIELDGIFNCNISNNNVILDGGQYGIRIIPSYSSSFGSDIDVQNCIIQSNVVHTKQNITSVGIEIFGSGDVRSNIIANNSCVADSLVSTTGMLINSASANIDGFNSVFCTQGISIDSANVAGKSYSLNNINLTNCSIGVQAPASYANKSAISLNNSYVQGNTAANFTVGSAYSFKLTETQLTGTNFVTANSLSNLFSSSVSVSALNGVTTTLFTLPDTDAHYIIMVSGLSFGQTRFASGFINTSTGSAYLAGATTSGAFVLSVSGLVVSLTQSSGSTCTAIADLLRTR